MGGFIDLFYQKKYIPMSSPGDSKTYRSFCDGIKPFYKFLEETGLEVIWNGNNCGRIEKGMFTYRFEFYHNGSVRETWEKNYKGTTHNDLETFLSLPE